jgi:hypothetical protein
LRACFHSVQWLFDKVWGCRGQLKGEVWWYCLPSQTSLIRDLPSAVAISVRVTADKYTLHWLRKTKSCLR